MHFEDVIYDCSLNAEFTDSSSYIITFSINENTILWALQRYTLYVISNLIKVYCICKMVQFAHIITIPHPTGFGLFA